MPLIIINSYNNGELPLLPLGAAAAKRYIYHRYQHQIITRALCSVQHAGAVFMPYFDFPTNLGRVHKQHLLMSIVLDMHVRNENVGAKWRFG